MTKEEQQKPAYKYEEFYSDEVLVKRVNNETKEVIENLVRKVTVYRAPDRTPERDHENARLIIDYTGNATYELNTWFVEQRLNSPTDEHNLGLRIDIGRGLHLVQDDEIKVMKAIVKRLEELGIEIKDEYPTQIYTIPK